MPNKYRNCTCIECNLSKIGEEITISGWVDRIRDHGGVLFLDLRDHTEILQIVSNDDSLLKGLTKESVIKVTGVIRKRGKDTYNPKLKTGEVELFANTLEVLNKAKTPLPFEIQNSRQKSEDLRLKYRYLDLRNKDVQKNILLRSEILHFIRNKMYQMGFIEVQTPILSATSPEGARDFLVPSRTWKGKFYALPQAPQIYKELLMVGGIEKYFQIAPCFRDEDGRKDRTLEFYQLDFEMSFVEEEEILKIGEEIFTDIMKNFSKKNLVTPFPRMTYKEAMEKYGTDKPDLRNPLIIKDVTEILKNTTFKPFKNSTIKAITVDEIGTKPNSWFDEIVSFASSIGMPGIGYLTFLGENTFKGPIDKFLTPEERDSLINECHLKPNSVLFFIANHSRKVAEKFAGEIRLELGRKANLIEQNVLKFCIVKDFPMFEWNEEKKKIEFCHNPFSLPHEGRKDYERKEPLDILAYQFDFVCNGEEMASGALRNHDLESLKKGFEIVGYQKEEIEKRFPSISKAFQYGAPPHGGMAPGLDRILMMILDEPNLREVSAFPTSSSGVDYLMGSPSEITNEELKEYGLCRRGEEK